MDILNKIFFKSCDKKKNQKAVDRDVPKINNKGEKMEKTVNI